MRLGKRERAAYSGKPSLFERDTAYRAREDKANAGPRVRSAWDNMHPHGSPTLEGKEWLWRPKPWVHGRKLSERCFKPST